MANSAFVLSSGVGSDGKSNRATKYQSSHGFSAGSVVRFEQTANGAFAFALKSGNEYFVKAFLYPNIQNQG